MDETCRHAATASSNTEPSPGRTLNRGRNRICASESAKAQRTFKLGRDTAPTTRIERARRRDGWRGAARGTMERARALARAWSVGAMLMATAVTIFFRSPIFPSSRKSRKARSTRSCLIHELPPSVPVTSSATETEMTPVSNRAQPSVRAARRARLFRAGAHAPPRPWGQARALVLGEEFRGVGLRAIASSTRANGAIVRSL
jgi:hypothetical protein